MSAAQRVALVVALVFLGGSFGYAIGARSGDASPPSEQSADVGFLRDMVAHHEQAIVMSGYLLAAGGSARVQTFAREIVQGQSYEIGLMEAYLDRWGYTRAHPDGASAMGWMGHAMPVDDMPGMASDDELDRIGDTAGAEADALFLALMKDHHRGGVEMASAAAADVADASVRALAQRIARNQAIEINELEATRVDLGLPDVSV